jgi:hypothetical protein
MACVRIGLYGAMTHQKLNFDQKKTNRVDRIIVNESPAHCPSPLNFHSCDMNIISAKLHRLPDQIPEEEDPVPPQHPDPDETPVPDHNPSRSMALEFRKYFRRMSW